MHFVIMDEKFLLELKHENLLASNKCLVSVSMNIAVAELFMFEKIRMEAAEDAKK